MSSTLFMLKISKMLVYKSQKYFYILSLLLLVPRLVFFFFFSEMFFVLWRLFQIIVFGWQVIGQRSTGHISRFTGSQIFGQILDSATSGSGNVLSRLIELIFFFRKYLPRKTHGGILKTHLSPGREETKTAQTQEKVSPMKS